MINEPAFDDRYCLFFDFLGTRAAAAMWSRDRLYEFVDLLRSIALARSTEEINGQSREDGSYRISVRPEISTFSDHVVVSWRTSGELIVDSLWTDIVLKDALRVLSAVAERALRIGLLVRGGMSVGQLFHGDDVVFGEAMVTAYELECSVAKYPRVVVAGGIIDRLNPTDLKTAPRSYRITTATGASTISLEWCMTPRPAAMRRSIQFPACHR
jgi:hypothetical protein